MAKIITLRLDEVLAEKLDRLATLRSTTRTAVITQAIVTATHGMDGDEAPMTNDVATPRVVPAASVPSTARGGWQPPGSFSTSLVPPVPRPTDVTPNPRKGKT